MHIPLLPMQAWSLKNAGNDLAAGFVNWLSLSSNAFDFHVLLRSLREIVADTEQLRAAISPADGRWAQVIVPYGDELVGYDVVESPDTTQRSLEYIVASRHTLVNNDRGTNVALLRVDTGTTFTDVLLCNHFVLDFYSVAWLVRSLIRRYIANVEGKAMRHGSGSAGSRYTALCNWIAERAGTAEISDDIFRSLETSARPGVLPCGVREMDTSGEDGVAGAFDVYVKDFGPEAVRRFWGTAERCRLTPYALGLALSTFRRGERVQPDATLLINIKESWRGVGPFNTIDIPAFLAVTSTVAVRNGSDKLMEHLQSTAELLSTRKIGHSTANFELYGDDWPYRPRWQSIRAPMMLYNSVDLRALGVKSGTEHLWGIYCSAGYVKREHMEVRFILTKEGGVSVWCAYRPRVLEVQSVKHYIDSLETALDPEM